MRRLPTLEDQDEALVRLGLWGFPGKSMKNLTKKEEKKRIYDLRDKLAQMLSPIHLPKIEAKKYRSADIDRLINP